MEEDYELTVPTVTGGKHEHSLSTSMEGIVSDADTDLASLTLEIYYFPSDRTPRDSGVTMVKKELNANLPRAATEFLFEYITTYCSRFGQTDSPTSTTAD